MEEASLPMPGFCCCGRWRPSSGCLSGWPLSFPIRDPELIEHEQQTMFAQRVLGIACGWEDLNDHHGLRIDPLMQVATERDIKGRDIKGRDVDEEHPLASPATLCRLENRVSHASCVALSKLLVELFIESFDSPPAELILDFDATDDPIHGNQEGRFFHGYYDNYCFLPLYVFCGEKLLVSYLRPANIDAARHSRAVLKLLVDRLRQQWPGVKIIFRGDSGFCRWKLLRWCDRHGVDYCVGLRGTSGWRSWPSRSCRKHSSSLNRPGRSNASSRSSVTRREAGTKSVG